MTRPLQCQMTNDQGGITFLPTHTCEHYGIVKPPTEGNCNFDMPCIGKYYRLEYPFFLFSFSYVKP